MSDPTANKINVNKTEMGITIVGGGMVGLSQALLLAKKNPAWRIALIENFPISNSAQPKQKNSFDNRSTALAEGSRSILQACGVWESLSPQLTNISQVHVSDRGHFSGICINASEYAVDALGYVVENIYLGQSLIAQALSNSSIQIFAPAKVTKLKRHTKGWCVYIQNSQTNTEENAIKTDLLILADGAQSSLAKSLGIEYRVESYGQNAIIANLECNKAHGGIAYERFTDQGPVALLPLGGSGNACRSALVWTRPQSDAESLLEANESDFLSQLQTAFGNRAGRFIRVSKRVAYPLQLAIATEQMRAGLVLMGNAAHFLHPVAGQGFNLALRDSAMLATVLNEFSKDVGSLSTLQTYWQRQQQDQNTTITLSDQLVKRFSTGNKFSALLRGLGLITMDAVGPAKTVFSQQAMGFPLAKVVQ